MPYEIRAAKHTHQADLIDVEFLHPEYGWYWTTAMQGDVVEQSSELYEQALASGIAEPYVPPTTEEAREAMPPISRRQLRLALVRNGISIASVEAIISAMPDGQAKEEAQIEWSDATMFERTHPTLLAVGTALGLSEAAVDAMWTQAQAI